MNEPRHSLKNSKKIPLRKALLLIVLSVLLISGTSCLAWIYYSHSREKQRQDPAYQIVAVVQTSPDSEGLKTGYLTELLELSVDRPANLYAFNTREAEQKLLSIPIIKDVKIRKIRPGTIHVDYSLRKPIAYVGDYTNAAVDAAGVILPFNPFYTPKKLPIIYFGNDNDEGIPQWGDVLNGRRKELAFALLALVYKYCDDYSLLSSIDVSQAFAPSDGQRQIVLVIEDRFIRVVDGQTILCVYPRILRLREDNMSEQLGNYLILRTYLREQDRGSPLAGKGTIQQAKAVIIDLRLSELAFLSSKS